MSNSKFVIVSTATGEITISVDSISSIHPASFGSRIVLKEVKDGNNVEISSLSNYTKLVKLVGELTK